MLTNRLFVILIQFAQSIVRNDTHSRSVVRRRTTNANEINWNKQIMMLSLYCAAPFSLSLVEKWTRLGIKLKITQSDCIISMSTLWTKPWNKNYPRNHCHNRHTFNFCDMWISDSLENWVFFILQNLEADI